jgi:hypothetical protein
MFLAAFCILFGVTGLVVCGFVLIAQVGDALAELDANSWR